MEYHDVITDCAAISLDAIEGTLEGLRGKNQNINAFSRRHGNFNAQSNFIIFQCVRVVLKKKGGHSSLCGKFTNKFIVL